MISSKIPFPDLSFCSSFKLFWRESNNGFQVCYTSLNLQNPCLCRVCVIIEHFNLLVQAIIRTRLPLVIPLYFTGKFKFVVQGRVFGLYDVHVLHSATRIFLCRDDFNLSAVILQLGNDIDQHFFEHFQITTESHRFTLGCCRRIHTWPSSYVSFRDILVIRCGVCKGLVVIFNVVLGCCFKMASIVGGGCITLRPLQNIEHIERIRLMHVRFWIGQTCCQSSRSITVVVPLVFHNVWNYRFAILSGCAWNQRCSKLVSVHVFEGGCHRTRIWMVTSGTILFGYLMDWLSTWEKKAF